MTKTVTTTVTLGVPGDEPGAIRYVPPGVPVTLDADEADQILARFGGAEVEDEADDAPAPVARTRRGRE